MPTLYSLFVHFYGFLTKVYAVFNSKVRLMVCGRKQTWNAIREKIQKEDRVLWMHCASLGEFEQGRVLIDLFRKELPDWKILLSFYSPSGYQMRKDYVNVDCVVYLPNDTGRNAKRFIALANPQITIFVKYEFWYNYIDCLQGRIVFQISLIIRENHYLRKWYGDWFRNKLKTFTHFFVQDETTAAFMKRFYFNNYTITGDTRFDRVFQIAESTKSIPLIEQWCNGNDVLILGSSWHKDEQILKDSGLSQMKIIIAPHQTDNAHILFIKQLFPHSLLYSDLTKDNINTTNIIIINKIGLLSSLYRYCHCAYVGGGFGVGIHNVLEAACFGKPVCFGPNYKKFNEANYLTEFDGARVITSSSDLKTFVNDMFDRTKYAKASNVCSAYVKENKGASQKILEIIKSNELWQRAIA